MGAVIGEKAFQAQDGKKKTNKQNSKADDLAESAREDSSEKNSKKSNDNDEKNDDDEVVERLQRPSRERHESALKRFNDLIEEQKKEIDLAKQKIKDMREQREKEQQMYQPIRAKLNDLAQVCTQLMASRDACRKEVQALDERQKDGGSKFTSVEAIDLEILRVEDQIAHETMSLKDEKNLVEKIKQLGKMKDNVRSTQAKQSQITGTDGSRKAMQEKAKAKDAEINANKAEQQKLKNEMDSLRAKSGGASVGNNNSAKGKGGENANNKSSANNRDGGDNFNKNIKALESERDGAYKTILKIRKEMDDLKEDFKKKSNDWLKREKLVRAEREKEYALEKKAAEERKKQWERDNAPEPFESEISSCDQLVGFLQKFLPKVVTPLETKNGSTSDLTAKLSGLKMMNKRDKDDEEDDLLSMTGTLTKAKKNKVANAKSAGPKQPKETDKVNLSLDAYGMFGKVGISAPLMIGEVPKAVEMLNAKKEEFLEKRRVKKERIAAGLEDPVEVADDDDDTNGKQQKTNKNGKKNKRGNKGGTTKLVVKLSLEVKDDKVVVTITERTTLPEASADGVAADQ